jgi:hypothetical protein
MDAATAEAITSAIVTHIDKLQSVHPSMKALTVDLMKSLKNLSYHPGAEAAYAAAN